MKIELTPVESSQIAAIGHDAASKTLAIQFKNKKGVGNTYHYDNVSPETYTEFLAAESKGRFFGKFIKDTKTDDGDPLYPYRKIEPETEKKSDESESEAA